MAARSKLTVESLAKLGAKRLAELLIVEAGRNRQLNWPALDRAARVVDARIAEIGGDLYELLDPAASALEGKHPLAAVLLRRRLIDFTLQKARATRYRHAVRHVREIESQQSDIADYGRHESHADYMARVKREHARKPSFWSLLAG